MNKSAYRTIQILELLSYQKNPMSFVEIQKQLNIPKSSTFELIETLLRVKAIEYADETRKTYRLSIKLFSIGQRVIINTDFYQIVHSSIKELSQSLNETTYFAIEKDTKIIYIDKVEPDIAIHSTCAIGSSNNMYSTGLGKAILATYTDKQVLSKYEGIELEKYTKFSITNKNILIEDLKNTRKRGYAIDNGEKIEYIRCIAAPVRDEKERVIGAISTSMLSERLHDAQIPEVSKIIVKTALEISHRLGYLRYNLYI